MPRAAHNLPYAEFAPATRRQFFSRSATSLAPLAFSSLCAAADQGTTESQGPLPPRRPVTAPRAKSIIFLFQIGGPSQIDLFDPKPELLRREGEPLPESILKQISFAQIQEKRPQLMGSPWRVAS